ncbi:MAG: hypothetical protein AAFR18_11730 [Cyanobacteria bacterium J06627_32]
MTERKAQPKGSLKDAEGMTTINRMVHAIAEASLTMAAGTLQRSAVNSPK